MSGLYFAVVFGMLGMRCYYVIIFLVQKIYILRKYNRKLAMFVPMYLFNIYIGFFLFGAQVGYFLLWFGFWWKKINLKSKINVLDQSYFFQY